MPETRARRGSKATKEPPDPEVVRKLERDLRSAMRRSRTRHEAADLADVERDRVITDAYEAGMSIGQIADVTELSKPRVDQIRRGSRQ